GFLLGTGVAQYPAWVGGTVLGHVLGNRIGSPAAYGLDFIFPAFFAAIAAGLWTKRSDVGPVVAGSCAALAAARPLCGTGGVGAWERSRMSAGLDIWIAVAGMALVTYGCRAGGFWAMGFVNLTPRIEAALAAMPSALVAAIVARAVADAGVIEAAAILAAFALARASGSDFVGMLAGIGAVAALRGIV